MVKQPTFLQNSEPLTWEKQQDVLLLIGQLDRNTLLPLWQQRQAAITQVKEINIAQLTHLDSAGLALLFHLLHPKCDNNKKLLLSGATDKILTLINLHNLMGMISII